MAQVIRNWSEYGAGWKQRGSLTVWVDAKILNTWLVPDLSGQRSVSKDYSDLAIATMATVKSVYGLADRQCRSLGHLQRHQRSTRRSQCV
jgi:hypothetical protein